MFFVIFSKQISNNFFKAKKLRNFAQNSEVARRRRWSPSSWERKKERVQKPHEPECLEEVLDKQLEEAKFAEPCDNSLTRSRSPSVGGGLKPPRGDHRRLPHLLAGMFEDCHAFKDCQKKVSERKCVFLREGLVASPNIQKSSPEASKSLLRPSEIEARSLQNRAPEPPKSSLEASKTQFLKTSYLRRLKKSSP